MNAISAQNYHWLKQISPAVLQWDQVPLFGASPEFPWEDLSSRLTQIFKNTSIKISHRETDWRNPEDFLSGLGQPVTLSLGVSNLEGSLLWLMPKSDMGLMMEALLGEKPESFIALDEDFSEGFTKYIATQTLFTLTQTPFGKNLGLSLLATATLPADPSLCLEIEIEIKTEETINEIKGRLIISPEALTSWKQRWADRSLSSSLKSPLAEKLQVPIHLEIGRTKLLHSEWSSLSLGDFVTLDHCTYDLEAEKGRVMLTINGAPMFRAKIKQGSVKILEFPFYHEASPMNHDDDEYDKDLEFEDDDDEESTDSLGDEETLNEDTLGELEPETEQLEEETEEEQLEESPAPPPPPSVAKDKKITPADISIDIIIEIGRIQMSMQKLMELEPGNMLDLDIHPENGVDLVVNGRRIGKGELLRIGDNLGVRVLDIG